MHQPAAAVILAAGASRRMGAPKALLRREGDVALARIVRTAQAAGCAPVIVVLGHHAKRLRAHAEGARIVENPAPDRGRTSSLKHGLRAAGEGRVLVWPVDHPAVTEATVRALLQAPADVAVPVHAGRRGHPILLGATATQEALALEDDAPLRNVVRRDAARVREIEVADAGVLLNLDTPEQAERAGWRVPGADGSGD